MSDRYPTRKELEETIDSMGDTIISMSNTISSLKNMVKSMKSNHDTQNENDKHMNDKIIPNKGEEFTEKELQTHFNIRNSGGIRPSNKNKVIILIDSYFSLIQGGYKDEMTEKSGFVSYVGEGEEDQKMIRNNKSILNSKQNGYALLCFEKPKPNKLFYKFQAEYDSWEFRTQKNSSGRERKAIFFKLKIIK